MNKTEATAEMQILLGDDVFGRLTPTDVEWCLAKDRDGDDYDPWLAAARAAELLGGRAKAGTLVRFTADGATFQKSQDWEGWAAWLRSQSPRSKGEGWDADWAFLIV